MTRTIIIPPNIVDADDEIILEIPRHLLHEKILYVDNCICQKCSCPIEQKKSQQRSPSPAKTQVTKEITPKSSSFAAFPYGAKTICTRCFVEQKPMADFPPQPMPYYHNTKMNPNLSGRQRVPQYMSNKVKGRPTTRPLSPKTPRTIPPRFMDNHPMKYSTRPIIERKYVQSPPKDNVNNFYCEPAKHNYIKQRHTVLRVEQVPQGPCPSHCSHV